MTEDEHAARQVFESLATFDIDAYESLLAQDAVEGRPQLGERFVGRDNIVGMYRDLPGQPVVRWRSIRGAGGVWVAEGVIDYGPDAGFDHLVAVVRIKDGMVAEINLYFASPISDPPPYHQSWSEPFDFTG